MAVQLEKIISGGQTGADQGALDAAIHLGICHGGWIPKGRKTENGPLPARYRLTEMRSASYPKRTEQNILDSDGTLIFTIGRLTGGSTLTHKLAKQYGVPCLHIDLGTVSNPEASRKVIEWLANHPEIKTLNVAGSRESKNPGIQSRVEQILIMVLRK